MLGLKGSEVDIDGLTQHLDQHSDINGVAIPGFPTGKYVSLIRTLKRQIVEPIWRFGAKDRMFARA
jgi:hypothetical protein